MTVDACLFRSPVETLAGVSTDFAASGFATLSGAIAVRADLSDFGLLPTATSDDRWAGGIGVVSASIAGAAFADFPG